MLTVSITVHGLGGHLVGEDSDSWVMDYLIKPSKNKNMRTHGKPRCEVEKAKRALTLEASKGIRLLPTVQRFRGYPFWRFLEKRPHVLSPPLFTLSLLVEQRWCFHGTHHCSMSPTSGNSDFALACLVMPSAALPVIGYI